MATYLIKLELEKNVITHMQAVWSSASDIENLEILCTTACYACVFLSCNHINDDNDDEFFLMSCHTLMVHYK